MASLRGNYRGECSACGALFTSHTYTAEKCSPCHARVVRRGWSDLWYADGMAAMLTHQATELDAKLAGYAPYMGEVA